MATVRYLRYDVFTDVAHAGNPLAVVIEPPPLTDDQHQRIAAALNLSETIFLRRRDDRDGADTASFDARIFTPARELPFAGHPTVGAAIALADEGWVARHRVGGDGGDERRVGAVELHEGVGAIPVVIQGTTARFGRDGVPDHLGDVDRAVAAAVLGLTIDQLHPAIEPSTWSAGVPYTIVAVVDLDALAQARIDPAAFDAHLADGPAPSVFVVCPLDGRDGERWRARMFAPELGIVEDPATGSAVAALYGVLADPPAWPRVTWTIEQGVEMGRPSTIELRARLGEHGAVDGYDIGGGAVRVGSGELAVPDPR